MESYILDWLQLILRSLHIITGIAWIGASFYFVWLDNHLRKPQSPELKKKGVDGELWAVHGGGFYNPQKYMVAPPELPQDLHWFYWESYSTWMSGFALFIVVYLVNAKTMMIDARVAEMSAPMAISAALAVFVCGWLIYDLICRFFRTQEKTAGLLIAILVALTAYVTCHVFAARAAFLITGAMMATIMSANVFFWIIPGQRKVIADMRAGRPVDPIYGQRGKQRSVHNTYFTLPVLFSMLSNHFNMITSHESQWLLLILMMICGVLIRHYFVARHRGHNQWWLMAAATTILIAVGTWLAPAAKPALTANSGEHAYPPSLSDVVVIFKSRCEPCHSDHPTMMAEAAKGLSFSDPNTIVTNAAAIYLQVVQQKAMPLGNVTEMTEAERDVVKRWIELYNTHK